jgi:hypothetical protein
MPTLLKPSPRKPLGCARSSASRPATGTRSCGARVSYNLGPRRHRDRLRGQHLDAPRPIRQLGALLLLVPLPREATVPHRELPGLRLR